MQEKHAPWKIRNGINHRVYLIDGDDGAVGEVVYADVRRLSDARLIAASPMLLRSVSEFLEATRDIGCAPGSKLAEAVLLGIKAFSAATRGEGSGI